MKFLFNKLLFFVAAFFLIFFNNFITFAQTNIFELPFSRGGGSSVGIIPDPMYMTVSYAYTNSPQYTDISASIFKNLRLTEYDAGKTFTIYEFDKYPEFTTFVDNLTNGANDRLQFAEIFSDIGGSASTALESEFFGEFFGIMTQNGIDFEGYQINSISLHIDSLTMSCNVSQPYQYPPYWCDYTVSGKLIIDAKLIDSDLDGVPDEHRVLEYSDLDMNGIDDRKQNNLRCVYNTEKAAQICVKIPPDSHSFGLLRTVDPERIEENFGKPQDFPFGLVSFRLVVDKGASVKIPVYFSEAAPLGSRWFKYDSIVGWTDFSSFTEFSYDRKSVVIELSDGGAGDSDGRANTIIIDPSGVGTLDTGDGIDGGSVVSSGGHGGGGCFISALVP